MHLGESFILKKLKDLFPYLHGQGTPVNIIVGSHVWIEDPDTAWIDGQVSKISGKDAEIETTNGKKVCILSINLFLHVFI